MDLNDVHVGEHFESTVRLAVAVAVEQQVAQVRVVLLDELFATTVPQSESSDLLFDTGIGLGATAVLRARFLLQREGVLMIQRKRRTGQLNAGTRREQVLDAEVLQMGV